MPTYVIPTWLFATIVVISIILFYNADWIGSIMYVTVFGYFFDNTLVNRIWVDQVGNYVSFFRMDGVQYVGFTEKVGGKTKFCQLMNVQQDKDYMHATCDGKQLHVFMKTNEHKAWRRRNGRREYYTQYTYSYFISSGGKVDAISYIGWPQPNSSYHNDLHLIGGTYEGEVKTNVLTVAKNTDNTYKIKYNVGDVITEASAATAIANNFAIHFINAGNVVLELKHAPGDGTPIYESPIGNIRLGK